MLRANWRVLLAALVDMSADKPYGQYCGELPGQFPRKTIFRVLGGTDFRELLN
jgi:hypothetical protein